MVISTLFSMVDVAVNITSHYQHNHPNGYLQFSPIVVRPRFTADLRYELFIYLRAGGATLIFDTELVAVNGEPASKSDDSEL